MKAFQLQEFGGPDALRPAELPDPMPGPGQVLIRVRAVSLNFRDLLMSRGIYNPKLKLPAIPVSDGAGEVVATGAGAIALQAGRSGCRVFHARLGGRTARR